MQPFLSQNFQLQGQVDIIIIITLFILLHNHQVIIIKSVKMYIYQ